MSQTILVVDDLASVRLYHMSFLTRKGYHCIGTGDGAAALAKLREAPVDLILLDMMMPGMDGDAFLVQLARIPSLATLPIILITSEEALAQRLSSNPTRPMSVLSKPVLPDTLLQRVQQLLPRCAAVPSSV